MACLCNPIENSMRKSDNSLESAAVSPTVANRAIDAIMHAVLHLSHTQVHRMASASPAPYLSAVMSAHSGPAPLTAAQRTTLAAAAEAVVPHAFADPARGRALVDAVVARIAALNPRKQRDLRRALAVLGSRAAAVV